MADNGWRNQPKRMSLRVIDAVVEQLAELTLAQKSPFHVCMHGGEPLLLGFALMTSLVSGLRAALPF